mmetsp:Transcript_91701/g.236669  ORF Transcript_91701/g.236669 Transcript_91701/m.236669 type:complete len:585 (-) Transcript_91701:471-2225(-)
MRPLAEAVGEHRADELREQFSDAEVLLRRAAPRRRALRKGQPLLLVHLLHAPRAQRLAEQHPREAPGALLQLQARHVAHAIADALARHQVRQALRRWQQPVLVRAHGAQQDGQRPSLRRRRQRPPRRTARRAAVGAPVGVRGGDAAEPQHGVEAGVLDHEEHVVHGAAVVHVGGPRHDRHVDEVAVRLRNTRELALVVLQRVRGQVVGNARRILHHLVVVVAGLVGLRGLQDLLQVRMRPLAQGTGPLRRIGVAVADGQLIVGADDRREDVHILIFRRHVHRQVVHDAGGEAIHGAAGHVLGALVAHPEAALEVVPQAEDVPGLVHDDRPQPRAQQVLLLLLAQGLPRAGRQEAHHAALGVERGPLLAPAPLAVAAAVPLALLVAHPLAPMLRERPAAALLRPVRDVGRQVVQVPQPRVHPSVRHEDVTLHDLAAPRVDLGHAHAQHLIGEAPRDGAEARVAHVVVARPVGVVGQHCADGPGVPRFGEGIVPRLHAFPEPATPTRWHRWVHVDADLAPGQRGEVVPPDHGHVAVEDVARQPVRQLRVDPKVLVLCGEVQQAVVADPRRHRRLRQLDHGEAHLRR